MINIIYSEEVIKLSYVKALGRIKYKIDILDIDRYKYKRYKIDIIDISGYSAQGLPTAGRPTYGRQADPPWAENRYTKTVL